MEEYWWIGLIVTFNLAVLIAVLTWGFIAASWKGKVEEFMKNTNDKLNAICDHIFNEKTTTSESPVRLTDLGRAISTEVGVRAWAKDNAPTFLPKVKSLLKSLKFMNL